MRIPLKYNVRSLRMRWVGTVMTALGIGLTVGIVVVVMGMVHGLDTIFVETGREDTLVVIREGSLNEVNSYFNRDLFETVRFLPGVRRDENNEPMAAGEIVTAVTHPRRSGENSNILIRGTSEMGFKLRPEVRLVEGRSFRDGLREIVASAAVVRRFRDMGIGESLEINNTDWKVVGVFEAEQSAYDSEIWAGYQDVAQVWQRPVYSSILVRADSGVAAQGLASRIAADRRIQLSAVAQKEYYRQQTISSIGLKALGLFVAVILAIGSSFAIMNMMYGAVMARWQEVATLRALGFKRRSILGSFLAESAILALLGGCLGCFLAFVFFDGYSAGTSNFTTLSEVIFRFRITPRIVALGMAFALVMGLLGGFLPARRAASVRLVDVLRE